MAVVCLAGTTFSRRQQRASEEGLASVTSLDVCILRIDIHFVRPVVLASYALVIRCNVFDMVFPCKVYRAPVTQWEALKHEYEHPAAECRIFCPREPPEELIAESQDDELLMLEVRSD